MVLKAVRKEVAFLAATASVLLADQAAKLLARNLENPVVIIKGLLSISPEKNTGAAFSLFPGTSLLLALIGIAVSAAVIILYKKLPEKTYVKIAAALILAGTLGNLIDRLIFGYVTDFISLSFWPAFNIADSALTIGAGLIILYFARDRFGKNQSLSQ